MTEEIFKDVVGYEGCYQVSNFGNAISLDRIIKHSKGGKRVLRGRVLKRSTITGGYLSVNLCKNGIQTSRTIHQLVAEAFLNHTPCGYKLVVNHINFNRKDNRIENLEIVTARENTTLDHIKSTSKYVGVHKGSYHKKWTSQIVINGKQKKLGYFKNEYDAHLAYQEALKEHNRIKTK